MLIFCQIRDTCSSHFLKDEKSEEEKNLPPIWMWNELNINTYISVYSFLQLIFCTLFYSFFYSANGHQLKHKTNMVFFNNVF
ncbi:BnaC09g12150D [Brassica napus]|uniref:BnaC09g12150D protein n=3 Tax=Brassica TaxID=3705 RepID=A0A078F4N1_BRANA|nr:BnaC09g12150D [Brassica napus]VDD29349.1 unnamed protein product [Brassica oleracea]